MQKYTYIIHSISYTGRSWDTKKVQIQHSEPEPYQDGAYGTRTRDLHTASVARSQLRQCPVAFNYSR